MVEDPSSVDAIAVALRVARAIEASGGAYFVVGSLASSMQGEPRTTNDIDIVLDLPIGRVREFARALGPDFEVDTDMYTMRLFIRSAIRILNCSSILRHTGRLQPGYAPSGCLSQKQGSSNMQQRVRVGIGQ